MKKKKPREFFIKRQEALVPRRANINININWKIPTKGQITSRFNFVNNDKSEIALHLFLVVAAILKPKPVHKPPDVYNRFI